MPIARKGNSYFRHTEPENSLSFHNLMSEIPSQLPNGNTTTETDKQTLLIPKTFLLSHLLITETLELAAKSHKEWEPNKVLTEMRTANLVLVLRRHLRGSQAIY